MEHRDAARFPELRWGIARRSTLLALGRTPAEIERLMREGALARIRNGWLAGPQAAPAAVRAVAHRGSLSCISALELHGMRRLRDDGLHLRVGTGRPAPAPGVWAHRAPPGWQDAIDAVDEPRLALACAARCLDAEGLVVVADSALESGALARDDLEDALAGTAARALLDEVDGRSQSVTESLVRLRLRRLGIRVRPQAHIPGVGRVDLLVGDRLIIECDSRLHHTAEASYRTDRRRTRLALVGGYLTLRLTYAEVLGQWDEIEADILALVRSRRHLDRSGRVA